MELKAGAIQQSNKGRICKGERPEVFGSEKGGKDTICDGHFLFVFFFLLLIPHFIY